MAKEVHNTTDENSNSEIVVSFDGVKMKEFRSYWTAVARGDWAGQDKFFAQVVKSWPFELDPNNPESYGELGSLDYATVQRAIKENSLEVSKMLIIGESNKIKVKSY